jgi:hypothetical protein
MNFWDKKVEELKEWFDLTSAQKQNKGVGPYNQSPCSDVYFCAKLKMAGMADSALDALFGTSTLVFMQEWSRKINAISYDKLNHRKFISDLAYFAYKNGHKGSELDHWLWAEKHIQSGDFVSQLIISAWNKNPNIEDFESAMGFDFYRARFRFLAKTNYPAPEGPHNLPKVEWSGWDYASALAKCVKPPQINKDVLRKMVEELPAGMAPVEYLCRHVGVSPSYFARSEVLHGELGISPKQQDDLWMIWLCSDADGNTLESGAKLKSFRDDVKEKFKL